MDIKQDNTTYKLKSGSFFSALGKYSGVFINLFIISILSRLLTPYEFGIVAIVTVFTTFFNLISDMGFGVGIVQNKSLNRYDIRNLFSFSAWISISLSSLFFLSAPIISKFYANPELIKVVRFLSVSMLFASLSVVPKALMLKNQQFKEIAYINVIIQTLTGLISIVLAYLGFSYYAIIFKNILLSFLIFVVYIKIHPIKLHFHFKWESISKIFKYSSYQFLFNLVNYFSQNLDNLLIGKYFGGQALAFYDKAYQLMRLPIQNLSHAISPAFHPVLSEMQDDRDGVFNIYKKLIKILAFIGFPLSVFLFLSAEEIVFIVFGDQWGDSVALFKLLSLSVGFQIILSSSGSFFQALNRTDLLFKSGALSSLLLIVGILYGVLLTKNLENVAVGLFFAYLINLLQTLYFLVMKVFNKPLLKVLSDFSYPILISISIIAIVLLLEPYLPTSQYLVSFIIKACITLTLYLTLVLLNSSSRKLVVDNYKKLKQRLTRNIMKNN